MNLDAITESYLRDFFDKKYYCQVIEYLDKNEVANSLIEEGIKNTYRYDSLNYKVLTEDLGINFEGDLARKNEILYRIADEESKIKDLEWEINDIEEGTSESSKSIEEIKGEIEISQKNIDKIRAEL